MKYVYKLASLGAVEKVDNGSLIIKMLQRTCFKMKLVLERYLLNRFTEMLGCNRLCLWAPSLTAGASELQNYSTINISAAVVNIIMQQRLKINNYNFFKRC